MHIAWGVQCREPYMWRCEGSKTIEENQKNQKNQSRLVRNIAKPLRKTKKTKKTKVLTQIRMGVLAQYMHISYYREHFLVFLVFLDGFAMFSRDNETDPGPPLLPLVCGNFGFFGFFGFSRWFCYGFNKPSLFFLVFWFFSMVLQCSEAGSGSNLCV